LLFLVYVHVIVGWDSCSQSPPEECMSCLVNVHVFLVLIIMDHTVNRSLVIFTPPTQRFTGLLYNVQAMLG